MEINFTDLFLFEMEIQGITALEELFECISEKERIGLIKAVCSPTFVKLYETSTDYDSELETGKETHIVDRNLQRLEFDEKLEALNEAILLIVKNTIKNSLYVCEKREMAIIDSSDFDYIAEEVAEEVCKLIAKGEN